MSVVEKQSLIRLVFNHIDGGELLKQFLVDTHCDTWRLKDAKEQNVENRLPREFLLRCMKCIGELWEKAVPREDVCDLEHANHAEKQECGKAHMHFDKEVSHGYFG